MTRPANESELVALLQWYQAMGADAAVADAPADWFAQAVTGPVVKPSSPAPQETADRSAAPARKTPTPSPAKTDMAAQAVAAQARSLGQRGARGAEFDGCGLKATGKSTCCARGSAEARAMFIGEGPGRDEDLQGLPFVGRAGQLLDKMLASIAMDESSAYITNIVYWRPPGNRTPTPEEVEACRPFLERQIELVDPDILVFLGGAAAKQLLDTTQGIMRLRGQWQTLTIGGKERRAMPTLHPAYLLRSPAHKRLAWRDLLAIKTALET